MAVAAAVAVTSAFAGATRWRVIGRDTDKARAEPVAAAFGETENPVRLAIRVLAQPNQRARGDWILTCLEGDREGGIGTRRGRFSARTPFTRPVQFPELLPEPRECQVSGSAEVKSGRVTVLLLAR